MNINRRIVAITAGSLLAVLSAYVAISSWLSVGTIEYGWLFLLVCGAGLAIAEWRRA